MVSDLLQEDDGVAVWWGTWVECAVAISRLSLEGRLDDEGERETRASLDLLAEDWREVQPTDEVRSLSALIFGEEIQRIGTGFPLTLIIPRLPSAKAD